MIFPITGHVCLQKRDVIFQSFDIPERFYVVNGSFMPTGDSDYTYSDLPPG
jgi:hypothetical protein